MSTTAAVVVEVTDVESLDYPFVCRFRGRLIDVSGNTGPWSAPSRSPPRKRLAN